MPTKYMKRRSTLFVITEMQMKATMRYHFISTRMAPDIPSIDEDAEQLELYTLVMRVQNDTTIFEESLPVSYKTKHTFTP